MSFSVDILRPYYLSGLSNISDTEGKTFKQWIESEPQLLDRYDSSNSKYYFYVSDKEKLLKSLAYDISRMSIAAFESICSISTERELPRSTAWPLIRSYYAAFFSAHTIMRIFGYSVVQLEKSQSSVLSKALQYNENPPSEKINDGLHLVKVSNNEPIYTMQKLTNGSHEDTWSVIAEVLKMISDNFLVDSNPISAQKKQDLYNQIDELISIIKTYPCSARSNWLSRMRNEINYQHKHGVWYPHEKSKNFREKVYTNLLSWPKSPNLTINKKTHYLDKYSQACIYFISMSKELMMDLSERNPNNNSFLKANAIKVLRQAEKVKYNE
ncbi:hypothetical protein [Pantoea ananatis]|uniref:hypothetical protein n=1 Tax=Pantoea ananas TaxID=553 RepID=UPI0011B03FFE|nr:hypothetical protein [Pantoea ananatis]